MIYIFENEDRSKFIEVVREMGAAPRFGTTIEHEGETYTRWPTARERQQTKAPAARKFLSHELPKNYRYHKKAGGSFASDGSCVFNSMAEVRETCAVATANGEPLFYGED